MWISYMQAWLNVETSTAYSKTYETIQNHADIQHTCTSSCNIAGNFSNIFSRYYAILHPMKSKYVCTISLARRSVVCIWIFSTIMATPTLAGQVNSVFRFQWRSTMVVHLHIMQVMMISTIFLVLKRFLWDVLISTFVSMHIYVTESSTSICLYWEWNPGFLAPQFMISAPLIELNI